MAVRLGLAVWFGLSYRHAEFAYRKGYLVVLRPVSPPLLVLPLERLPLGRVVPLWHPLVHSVMALRGMPGVLFLTGQGRCQIESITLNSVILVLGLVYLSASRLKGVRILS